MRESSFARFNIAHSLSLVSVILLSSLHIAPKPAIATPNADLHSSTEIELTNSEAGQLIADATPEPEAAVASAESEVDWGTTALEQFIQVSQSPVLKTLIQSPTIANQFGKLGKNLKLEVDGETVADGSRISSPAGLATTLASRIDRAGMPKSIVIRSNDRPVFLSVLEEKNQQLEMRSQLLNQPSSLQTLQLPKSGTARGVLTALGVLGIAPDNAATITAFIGDLDPQKNGKMGQLFTKMMLDLQGLGVEATPQRINAIIASYNRIMSVADSDTVNTLSQNPNFRMLSSMLQNLSEGAASRRETIVRNEEKKQQAATPEQKMEQESFEGFVFTGLGAS